MKALKDFFRENYIFLLTLYVAVVLLTFLENVLKNMHYTI